ncbi:tripeptidyl aminopeptidase [Streptomyces inusitatus]|uniref:Tripeptidyl aminopeptidase n=1 Tax=Streptomyces inusitatus TaxID=68221 RepID=A0A918Q7T0_9ACTN|nr:aminopeptidase [Streptomyces inusitatus]GGZ34815.1 tripeptidyl aminopeptidase [Streptomyces inusitatus]
MSFSGTPAAALPETPITDIKPRLAALPEVASVRETTSWEDWDRRVYEVFFTQPKDHRDPAAGTFRQKVVVYHRGERLPTALIPTQHAYGDPLGITFLKNEVRVEQRFLPGSELVPKDLSKLNIRQLADDLHRVTVAMKRIYDQRWLSTGMALTGEVATYHRRFYPNDVVGTYVVGARNDAHNDDDSAYEAHLAQRNTPECRERIESFQREALIRRDELVELYRQYAQQEGFTFQLVGSVDRAFEISVTDFQWRYWQQLAADGMCPYIPSETATTAAIWDQLRLVSANHTRADWTLRWEEANIYLAGTQTGWPAISTPHLDDLLRYPGINNPRTFVDRAVPMQFDNGAMADIDTWVREHSSNMIYVYGEYSPIGAEPFQVNESRDSKVYVGPTYGDFSYLTPADQKEIEAKLKEWAGVAEQPPARG